MNPITPTGIAPVDPKTLPEYSPTPLTDFSRPEHKTAFEQALASVRGRLAQEHALVIGGERLKGERTFESRNPARPAEVVGRFQSGSKEQATRAELRCALPSACPKRTREGRARSTSACSIWTPTTQPHRSACAACAGSASTSTSRGSSAA